MDRLMVGWMDGQTAVWMRWGLDRCYRA